MDQTGFRLFPIEPARTTSVAAMPFPPGHKGPFDRLLIAQAVVGADAAFARDPARRIW